MNPIPYGRQDITADDIRAVTEVLQSDFLTQGPKVAEFEEAFSRYVDAKYSIAVSNGTAALHLAALALGVNEKSRVITTPITFAASANCILYCGGKVEFADIDPETGLIDINDVIRMVESKPRGYYQGIIPVDFAGYPVDAEKFNQVARKHGLWIIEDACHAPGGYFTDSKGKIVKCGSNVYSDLSIFSFHPVKHIATGEGGMITTNDERLYKQLVKLRTHGITKNPGELSRNEGAWYYEMQDLGFNYRIPDMLCALGLSQLSKASERLERRIQIAKTYDKAFKGHPAIELLSLREYDKGIQHAFHLYVIKTPKRLQLYNDLRRLNIFTQVHYIPVHKMPYYQHSGFEAVQCPKAEAYYEQCLSLPMYPTLTKEQQQYVIDSILNSLKD
jgi:UDP-4-amino-4,6-dideoxy-N-acetyl-beta-L-altrosamine transaminase